ncbi:hypothetical protein GCM10018780_86870 [Streptomyces lanatus]|nr:hypothetical protein GCM10018780_86870 [Streptomyces lanatus]
MGWLSGGRETQAWVTRGSGLPPGMGVVTLAASLNAAEEATAEGGADPPSIVCAPGT